MQVSAHADIDVVALETEDEVSVLVELAAPAAPTGSEPRLPATLQVVLDRSGSMGGGRLRGAKAALLTLVDRLDPTDNFGLVAFDNTVAIVIPAGPLSNKAAVRAAITAIDTGGSTDLSGGYLRGLQEARRVAGPTGATLLLISDGHANAGVTDPDALKGVAAQAHNRGVVTSTLGYGLGYDELLLGAIADGGAGEALFAEEPDSAGKLLAAQVDGLLAKAVQAASLTIRMGDPVSSVIVMGDLPMVQLADGAVMVELGDLWAGETRKLVLRFRVPAIPSLGLTSVASLVLQYVALPSLDSHEVTLPIAVNVVPGDEATGRVADPVVRTEVAFQQAQESKRKSSEALRLGDQLSAVTLLHEANDTLLSAMAAAPESLRADLSLASFEVSAIADRVGTEDANRLAKETHASWHSQTRRRGRPQPPQPEPSSDDDDLSGQ
jgi:Ca-activated chloride channel family protein